MKKLGKLSINPEKIIKDVELVNLRGGYGGDDNGCGTDANNCSGKCVITTQIGGYSYSVDGTCKTSNVYGLEVCACVSN